jgi:hypothetical protein
MQLLPDLNKYNECWVTAAYFQILVGFWSLQTPDHKRPWRHIKSLVTMNRSGTTIQLGVI